MLANLQERRVAGGFDEVARRIDLEQAHRASGDLAAQQDRHIEGHVLLLHRLAMRAVDAAHRFAHQRGGGEHGRHGVDGFQLAGFGIGQAVLDQVDHRLRDRKVAGRHRGDQALAGAMELLQFGEAGDVVEARIGAGIGQHHQPLVEKQANTIGHEATPGSVRIAGRGGRSRRDAIVPAARLGDAHVDFEVSAMPPWRTPRIGAASW